MSLITTKTRRRFKPRDVSAVAAAGRAAVERLEAHTLLSAWSTINTYSYPNSPPTDTGSLLNLNAAYSMAQDSAGNLYAAGQAYDSTGTIHGIVLERYAGNPLTSWTTIEDLPNATFNKMATDSAGDLLVTGESNPSVDGAAFVAVRPVFQSGFTIVDDTVAPANPGGPGITLDGSGNAFFDTTENETVNGVSQQHWVIQKVSVSQLLSGQSAFTTVDDFYSGSQDYPHNITCVPSGASAGLYVVGQLTDASSHNHWIVRKSSDGGNSWSTVDDFIPAGTFSATSNVAYGVSGDLSGNSVYVVGNSLQSVKVHNKTTQTSHWIVRKSSNGGASWTVADNFTNGVSAIGVPYATIAYKVEPDRLGNMYVVGVADGTTNNAVVRANTGPNGSWVTVDSYSAGSLTVATDYNLLIDSSNNHYICGDVVNNNTDPSTTNWLIRTDASATASPAAIESAFPSTQTATISDSTAPLRHRGVLSSGSAARNEGALRVQQGGRKLGAAQLSRVELHQQAKQAHAAKIAAARANHTFAHPNLDLTSATVLGGGGSASPAGVTNPTPIPGTLAPGQVVQAYGFDNVVLPDGSAATGAGETIGIVDADHDPNIQSDLHTFDVQYFGGIDPTFTQVNLGSSTNTDPTGGWEREESLDVEWAHAIAPQASIILVEAASNSYANLLGGADTAVSLGANVVSMSWGGGESSSELSWDSHFEVPNVAFVTSSGDSGAPAQWPSASPQVLSVGGTSIALNAGNNWSSEVGWFKGGGGISTQESLPVYQPTTYNNGTTTGITLTKRGTPDVAYDASRESSVSIYDSHPNSKAVIFNGTESGWFPESGTSVGAPQWAASIALADQGRAEAGLPQLGTTQVLSTLYANPGDFHDIVSGTSVGSPNYSAAPGYDLVTGLGSPQAPLVISSLIGVAPTAAPASPNGLSATPGNSNVSLQWNATSGASSWNIYRSVDGVNFTLYTSTSQTEFVDSGLLDGSTYYYEVTAVNSVGESAASTSASAVPQIPPAAPTLKSATPTNNTFGGPGYGFGVALQWGAVSGAVSYTILRSATPGTGYAVVASDVTGTSYTDISTYAATKYYYVVEAIGIAGAISSISNQLSATTIPSAPTNLTATAGNTQVSLSWTASAGATSYEIFRSTTNGSGYTLIAGGIASNSYVNTRLTNGKTYYYVVEAVDSGGPSANSNQAAATPLARKG